MKPQGAWSWGQRRDKAPVGKTGDSSLQRDLGIECQIKISLKKVSVSLKKVGKPQERPKSRG